MRVKNEALRGKGSGAKLPIETRFWCNVDKSGADGCWLWLGKPTNKGYGTIKHNYKTHKAHRWSYEHHKGTIPEGLMVDHRCRVRLCVNPDHLRVVTAKQNAENRAVVTRGKSKYLGVSYHPTTGKWVSRGTGNGLRVYLGLYEQEIVAAKVAQDFRLARLTHNDEDRMNPIVVS